MKIKKDIKITEEVFNMLINHFNYSIEDINSYEELTSDEKRVIPKDVFNQIVEGNNDRNYEEIIDILNLKIKLVKVDREEQYDILTITGDTSSSGFYTLYDSMREIQEIIEGFVNSDFKLDYSDIWLISWNTDLINDNWILKIGVNK